MSDNIFMPSSIKERTKILCDIIYEITKQDVFQKTRKREVVIARMMVACQLREEGVSEANVSRLLNKNHVTIRYYQERLKIALTTPGYETERQIWKEFKKRIDEERQGSSQGAYPAQI